MDNYSEHYNRVMGEVLTYLSNDKPIEYPIKHINEFGEWILHEDGELIVKPNYAVETIDVKITISDEGIEFFDKNN